MSIVAVKTADGTSVIDYLNGTKTGTLVYNVPINDKTAAYAATGLPQLFVGAPHPTEPALKLDNVTFSPIADSGGSTLTFQYSNNGRFGGNGTGQQPTPTEDLTDALWGWEESIERFQVPYQQLVSETVVQPTAAGQAPSTIEIFKWQFGEKKPLIVKQRKIIRPLTFNIKVDNVRVFDAGSDQADTVHNIRGRRYLFLGQNIRPLGKNVFNVSYRWELDNGVYLNADAVTNPGSLVGPFVPGTEPQTGCVIVLPQNRGASAYEPDEKNRVLLLSPFMQLVPLQSNSPGVLPCRIQEVPIYGDDPNGWRNLIGTEVLV